MKSVTLILAMAVLFLSILPGIQAFSSGDLSADACCGAFCHDDAPDEKTAPLTNDNEHNGAKKHCNPFKVCSCCLYVCNNPIFRENNQLVFLSVKKPLFKVDFHTRATTDFWKPPRFL